MQEKITHKKYLQEKYRKRVNMADKASKTKKASKFKGFNNILAVRLRQLMYGSGTTQQELAEKTGCSRQAVAQYMDGSNAPNIDKLILIAEFFNVSIDYLVGKDKEQTEEELVQSIVNYTGLSEKAVDVLHFYKDYETICPTVNRLLESEMSSFLQELGYMCSDMPKDKLKEKCKEYDIDFNELEKIIKTKDYECLQVVSAIEQYLNIKKTTKDKLLSISKSGKIISLSETDLNYTNKLTYEDLISVKTIRQSQLIENVMLENAIEKIKQLKKDGENNGNNP